MLARISHGVAQALNPVALYLAHGAGIIIQPDRFRSVLLRGGLEFLGNDIERLIPRDRLEIIQGRYCGFGPLAAQRLCQTVGMMHPLGVTCDLRADHARRIAIRL